jgi:hypothetical protein
MAVFDPPVYQAWLSVVQKFTLQIPALVAFYAAVLSVLTPWCWYRFLRETLDSKNLALAGWAALSLLPTWIGIYSYFMTETLLLPLLGTSLWMTCRARRRRTVATFMAMVVLWTITGLTRGIAIPLAATACAWVWFSHPRKLLTAAASGAFVALALVPLSVRNHHFVHLWAPHGNGYLTQIYAESGAREIALHLTRDGAWWEYGFAAPMLDERPFAPLSDWKSMRTGTVHAPVDLTQGTRDWKAVRAKTAKQGAERWRLRWENFIFLFQGNSWPDNNPAYFMGRLANLSRWLWLPLFGGVLALSVWCWRSMRGQPLLPLLIAVWFFFQGWLLIAVNEGRYRKPAEGLLIAQVLVLAETWRRVRRSNPGPTPSTP